jgi:hypothetical protein
MEGANVKRFLLYFVCVVSVSGATRGLADEKPQDKAKAVAVAFAKAVNARDVDGMMKLSNVPYYVSLKGKDTETVFFDKAEDLKADMKQWVGKLRADHRLSETVAEVLTREEMLKKARGVVKADDPEVKLLREVLNEDGYVVVLGADPNKASALLLVAIQKDGKAKVIAGGYR